MAKYNKQQIEDCILSEYKNWSVVLSYVNSCMDFYENSKYLDSAKINFLSHNSSMDLFS